MKKLTIIGSLLVCSLLVLLSGCRFWGKKEVDVCVKNDWIVSSNLATAKAQNEYDVIVVGAGIGGLTSASLLAASGYKVLVLEQQHNVGGFCASFQRDGFIFPVGAHDISGVEQGMIKMLLDKLHLNKDDLFALHTRTYLFGDKKITFTGTKNDVVQKLSEQFPGEQKAIVAFFNEAEQAFAEGNAHRTDPTKFCPTYQQWKSVTYQQKLDAFFHDAELKKFLCSLLGYFGTKPENTIASNALKACLGYFIYGGHYPKKGGQAFADALKNVVLSHGGTVLTGTKVDEILVANNHVVGVRTGDNKYLSPIVIANANAKTIFLKLIPQGILDQSFVDAIAHLTMSGSLTVVNLGVDLDLSYLSSINHFNDKIDFSVNSNADASNAPQGKSTISMERGASYADVPAAGTPDYEAYKEQLAQKAIADLEKVIPGVSGHIIVKNVTTPRTFEQFTSMPEGGIYSFDQSAGSKRPYFKTPVQGLYLASASTLPGGGVEAVVAAGFICVRDILTTQAR
jgi:all-trans-retinol 13,14-reductase